MGVMISRMPDTIRWGGLNKLSDIGVLWSGDHLFPGTVETLEMLRSNGMLAPAGEKVRARDSYQLGKQVVFVTNNSTKSRADYKKKLEKLGIPSTTVCL